METIRLHIEKLLRRAAASPTRVPHLVRALSAVEVIFLGDYILDSAKMPHTQICACKHQGRLVLPCFSSREQLHMSGLDHHSCLVASFADFLIMVRNYGQNNVPVVVNLDSPAEWTLLPEQLVALSGLTVSAACIGKKPH